MAGAQKNPPRTRKRVDIETNSSKRVKDSKAPAAKKDVEAPADTSSLRRAKDGSAFTKCDECNKDVPVMLIDMHNCSLDSKIKMQMESMVVEKVVDVKKPAEKKKEAKPKEAKPPTKTKKVKDPNEPKRPPTAFFLFMDDFRKSFKAENPDNKSIAVVGKAGGEKWKTMPEDEKKVYLDRAAQLKEKYKNLKSGKETTEEGVADAEKEHIEDVESDKEADEGIDVEKKEEEDEE